MARSTITRRKFIQLSAAATAGSLLAACGAGGDDEPAGRRSARRIRGAGCRILISVQRSSDAQINGGRRRVAPRG